MLVVNSSSVSGEARGESAPAGVRLSSVDAALSAPTKSASTVTLVGTTKKCTGTSAPVATPRSCSRATRPSWGEVVASSTAMLVGRPTTSSRLMRDAASLAVPSRGVTSRLGVPASTRSLVVW
eukprot:scaffold15480_cov66-Phaeocystis_antarctica.AAC.2